MPMAEHLPNVKIPVWSGQQPLAGLWYSARLFSAEESAARMLGSWVAGSTAFSFEQGHLLRFAGSAILNCEAQSGLPLCAISNVALVSAPLNAEEISRFRDFDILVVAGAQVEGLHWSEATAMDLSHDIDIGEYALHDTFDGSQTVRPLNVKRMAGKDIRTLLGDAIPPPSSERGDFLEHLASAGKKKNERGSGLSGDKLTSVASDFLGRFAFSVLSVLGAAGSGSANAKNVASKSASIRNRLLPLMPEGWREALAKLAIASRVSRLIGWKQGAYLRKMLKMFDDGNIDEALRHAIPIDSLNPTLGQAFGSPGRRQDLSLSGSMTPSTEIGFDHELQQHLRKLYRQSFERLDRLGKIDEAVFVLADLLNARMEALDYLERHNRISQAAELALAWDMPAATIIRLLLLAGDWNRAVQVARRDNEFGGVIAALQASHPDLVVKLRLAWGDYLADSGEWLAAVEAVWPVQQARAIALTWLLTAERAGEELSARALIKRAALLPDTIEQYAEKIIALSDANTSAQIRSAIAEALLEVKFSNNELGIIATAVLPAIAADRGEGLNDLSKAKLNKLATISNDPFLKADLPNWEMPALETKNNFWNSTGSMTLQAPSAGLQSIHDVVALADNCYLVALGEAGSIIVDRAGKTLQRYAVPCYHIVISANQRVALSIARRESFCRVARLDLVNHTVADIGTLKISFFDSCYDGAAWTVVSDNRILVLDTAKSLNNVLWHVGDMPGTIVRASFSQYQQQFLLSGTASGFEYWNYSLPSRRLTERTAFDLDPEIDVLLFPAGNLGQPKIEFVQDAVRIKYPWNKYQRYLDVSTGGKGDPLDVSIRQVQNGLLVGLHYENSIHYALCRASDACIIARFDWPGAIAVEFREQNEHVLFFDKQGRVLDIPFNTCIAIRLSLS